MRPNLQSDNVDEIANNPRMVLPLHQRLQLIRNQRGCTTSEARRLLWDPSGEFSDPWSNAVIYDESEDDRGKENENVANAKIDHSSDLKGCAGAGFSEVVHPCVLAVHSGVGGSVLMCAPGKD